jgi:hypothetical protein
MFIWCLAFIFSNFVEMPSAYSFSYIFHPPIVRVNMQCCHFFVYIPSSYHALALHQSSVRPYHASTSYAELILFIFLWFWLQKAISKKRKEKCKLGDVCGPPDRRKRRLSRFVTTTANPVEVPSLHDEFISPTPPSQVLALSWQCDNWFHVAYIV